MPKPTSFKTTNRVFGEQGANIDQIAACLMLSEDGKYSIVTKWKLSDEDLQIIEETGEIWLVAQGTKLPPLSILTKSPSEHGYRVIEQ